MRGLRHRTCCDDLHSLEVTAMSPHIDPPSTHSSTTLATYLTPAEIGAAVIPGLVGMAAVALIAVLMLL